MLALGPWIVARATGQTRLRDGVDGFIFVSIAGLVLVDIFPHLFEDLGWWAPLLMALGLWGPDWIEHRFRAAARSTHLIVVLVAACGLVVHTAADGAVLGDLEQGGLSLAVVLHRLPVAMAVWWLLRPSWGKQGALLLLAVMALGTVAGFAAGRIWLVDTQMTAVVEALVAGSILHVVFNRLHLNPALPAGPVVPSAEGWGNLLGLAFLLVVYGTSLELPAGMQAIGNQLYSLALVAAPAVLLGYLLAGLLTGLVPVRSMAWIGKGSTARQSLNGMLVGLPMPVCSCGVVPLYRSLSQQGVPPAAGLAFLVATPELGLDALIVSLPLLGLDMTLARLIAAALIAWLVGTLLGAWVANPRGRWRLRALPRPRSCQGNGAGSRSRDELDRPALRLALWLYRFGGCHFALVDPGLADRRFVGSVAAVGARTRSAWFAGSGRFCSAGAAGLCLRDGVHPHRGRHAAQRGFSGGGIGIFNHRSCDQSGHLRLVGADAWSAHGFGLRPGGRGAGDRLRADRECLGGAGSRPQGSACPRRGLVAAAESHSALWPDAVRRSAARSAGSGGRAQRGPCLIPSWG